ncbi:MAG TPA: phosphoribosylaminoimidazolesuccinocarboxamide synthase [Spirochaetes bacterium]|nr:phosphoribosylaminoimidazolesuccinocarboxamide synthase [Spirochaetota bacterium]
MEALTRTKIPGAKKLFSGKVRDVYSADSEHLIIISTDRVSAFDHVFPNGIPGKGVILNMVSNLWFSKVKFIQNHIVETDCDKFPKPFREHPEQLLNRSVMVRKARRIDFECVARGYLIGSGWKDYEADGEVCGIPLPPGLALAQRLPAPLFTPATKAESGHDQNVSVEEMRKKLGADVADRLGEITLQLYDFAGEKLKSAGILLADTKFEFGFVGNEIVLIDEILTPDSSRFWDAEHYRVGSSPVSYDKQFIRDYLETTTWDKNSAPPPLPEDIIIKTREKYSEILDRVKTILQ